MSFLPEPVDDIMEVETAEVEKAADRALALKDEYGREWVQKYIIDNPKCQIGRLLTFCQRPDMSGFPEEEKQKIIRSWKFQEEQGDKSQEEIDAKERIRALFNSANNFRNQHYSHYKMFKLTSTALSRDGIDVEYLSIKKRSVLLQTFANEFYLSKRKKIAGFSISTCRTCITLFLLLPFALSIALPLSTVMLIKGVRYEIKTGYKWLIMFSRHCNTIRIVYVVSSLHILSANDISYISQNNVLKYTVLLIYQQRILENSSSNHQEQDLDDLKVHLVNK